jgi:hypothetical protein
MAAKSKRQDELKKREKRSKILLAVLGVLFLAVGAYEVPSVMKMMNKKPPPGTTYDPGPDAGPGTSVLPNVAGSSTTGVSANGRLVNSDVPPPADGGQLVSFSVFQAKDPFVPQVTADAGSGSTDASSSGAGNAGTTTTPSTTTTNPTTTSTTTTPTATVPSGIVPPTSTSTTPTTTAPAAAPTVAISVNGAVSRVSNGGTFPTGAPVFRLASWSKGTAQISIVGGSYASGNQTLALRQGVSVTLENTTDGKRYKLVLLSTPSG